jgi:type I restriction enzyme M protein
MTSANELKVFLKTIGFVLDEGVNSSWSKAFSNHNKYKIRVDIESGAIDYGKHITIASRTTENVKTAETLVVLECVNRLLEKGYKPKNIVLEKTWRTGHGTSGRLDILVTRDDGSAYLMIECKTFGVEYEKEATKIKKDGGQLFTYFQQDKNAEILLLYTSQVDKGRIEYKNQIVKIDDDYRQTGNVKDFHDRWNKLPKLNGVFDEWVNAYNFESEALTPKDLKDIGQEDSGFIFNHFLEILRHNVVSDKPNAFNKIFTLFLCKIYDEKATKRNEELAFQWFYTSYSYEGSTCPPDDNISFQKRLTDLYRKGMKEFLDKTVTDISDSEFERKYGKLETATKKKILDEFTEIRLKKNNEFAIKEVFDDESFEENAKVVKEVVELLQGYKIRYTKKHQYLSDFFELLLTTGLKQESGQFFTPVPIAQFIIKSMPLDKIVMEKLEKGERNNLLPAIIDYAAGSGHFITESMHEVQRIIDAVSSDEYINDTANKIKSWKIENFEWAFQYIYGIEKDYRLVKVGKVGCYLHGDGLAQIVHSDGLGNFKNTEGYKGLLRKTDKNFPQDNKQFDIVVSNPPYSVSAFKNNARRFYTEDDFQIYDKLTDQSSEIECLFIERTKQLLKDGGLAGIILPSSILSNSGIYTRAREIILQYFDIVGITELGGNTFMATSINTVALFLRRRSNYDSVNIRELASKVFENGKDIVINGIEKPLAKYVSYVWKDISLSDFITLILGAPNQAVVDHENYKDYVKKFRSKEGKTALSLMLNSEMEKFFYFLLAYPQRLVLIKPGKKNAEKDFLGYEFSNRRGSEGIHPRRRSKTIDQCTKLFDAEVFDNPEKASTYLYKAFQGITDLSIHSSIAQNISYVNLIDMMTFDRVDFEKTISTSIKKKVQVTSKWPQEKLSTIVDELQSGNRPKGGVSEFQSGIPSLGGEHIGLEGQVVLDDIKFVPNEFFKNAKQGILKDLDILICKDGALTGKVALFNEDKFPYKAGMVNEHVFILRCKDANTQKALFYILLSETGQNLLKDNISGQAQGGLNRDNLLNIKIPKLSPTAIKTLVREVESIEVKIEKCLELIKSADQKKNDLIQNLESHPRVFMETLAENLDYKRKPVTKGHRSSGEIPYYGASGIVDYVDEYVIDDFVLLISEDGANLTSRVSPIAFTANGKSWVNNHAHILKFHEKDDHKLTEAYLNYTDISEFITGQAQPKLNQQNLNRIRIPVPKEKQVKQKFIQQLELYNNELERLRLELNTLKDQREGVTKRYILG